MGVGFCFDCTFLGYAMLGVAVVFVGNGLAYLVFFYLFVSCSVGFWVAY